MALLLILKQNRQGLGKCALLSGFDMKRSEKFNYFPLDISPLDSPINVKAPYMLNIAYDFLPYN